MLKANPDILFVVSPTNAREIFMPFYYLSLASFLEKNNFAVDIIDPHYKKAEDNEKVILREIINRKPKFVGLASFVTDYDVVYSLATFIKKYTKSTIIVGNAHPSLVPQDFIFEGSPFDIVVRGEGELTLKDILTKYDHDLGDVYDVKGIAYFRNSIMWVNQNRELMDLSDSPVPAYHKIDLKWYRQPSKNIIRKLPVIGAFIYTSRGCPFDCSFCASNSVWNTNDLRGRSSFRRRPLGQVMEELDILQNKFGFEFFYILDDTFGLKKDEIFEFCDLYRNSGLKMLWAAETRVNCIDDDIAETLKVSGCVQLDFGVESGSQRLLDNINKQIKIESTIRAFELCRRHGIRTFANMLLNLPGETEHDLTATGDLLKILRPNVVSVGITQPYPGTDIYKKLKVALVKEDYGKLSRLEPSEDLRLAAHKINLVKLLLFWQIRYGVFTVFDIGMFQANRKYWFKILKSKKAVRYIIFFISEILKNPLRLVHKVLQYCKLLVTTG